MARLIERIPARPELTNRAVAPTRKIRLAAYARVSSNNEDQLYSFENQVKYYRDFTALHPEYTLVDIYADEAITGTNTRRRDQFKRMIADCDDGKIDMVITKSVSRFARNTQDSLFYARKLRDMNIPILFERENINTLDGKGEVLFTILASLAQDESRSISENCAWGIRALFQQGTLHLNAERFLGYDKDKDGKLTINEQQAKTVRRIFTEYMNGVNPDIIAKRLRDDQVPTATGRTGWTPSTITSILKNEKHMGDALLQKYYTADFLTGKTMVNNGALEQFYVKGDHDAIIPKEYWEAVQLEMARRKAFMDKHGLRTMGRYTDEQPFTSRVLCSECGKVYWRRSWYRMGRTVKVWQCGDRYIEKGAPGCKNINLHEEDLHNAFMKVWNDILTSRQEHMTKWQEDAENENPLVAFRAKQMMELTDSTTPMRRLDMALVSKVLDCVTVHPNGTLEFLLLDGTSATITK